MVVAIGDEYMWAIEYHDGSSLPEFDGPGTRGRGFAEVGTNPVKRLSLLSLQGGSALLQVAIPEGAWPLFFRRRKIELNPGDNSENRSTVHCIGWKRSEEDACYLFVFEDGSTLLTSDLQAV